MVKTRFAPSPTGYLHIGGARTALFNYLYAKAHGGKFVLRIEDTDQKRSTKEACDQVIESMKWLKLSWDEGPEIGGESGPYFQSERLGIYDEYFQKLLDKNLAYRCFCSDEELVDKKKRQEAMGMPPVYDGKCRHLKEGQIQKYLEEKKPHTIRFKVPSEEIFFDDLVRGKVKFDTKLIGDYVIRKSDGFPTYNFAVVVDDATMGITHIIRGDDHISNTPRQIMLYKSIGFDMPTFCHVSMILGSDREKLSKRHGATSVLEYKKEGYLVDPLNNFLALLGWSPKDGEEVISWEKLQKSFLDAKFSGAPAVFDFTKLDYLNGHYIRNHDEEEIFDALLPFLKVGPLKDWFGESYFEDGEKVAHLKRVVSLLKGYIKKLPEINDYLEVFYRDEIKIDPSVMVYLETEEASKLLGYCVNFLKEIEVKGEAFLSSESFKAMMKGAKKDLGIGGKGFFKPLRAALSGKEDGVELNQLFEILSISSLIVRLRNAKH